MRQRRSWWPGASGAAACVGVAVVAMSLAPDAAAAGTEIAAADLVAGAAGANRNAAVIQRAIDGTPDGGTITLPEGQFVVETVFVRGKKGLTIRGQGRDRTTLRRAGFAWDNDAQGDCPQTTEVLWCETCDGLTLRGLTLDGSAHHMAIKGPGTFGPDGSISSGTPQFPRFTRLSGTVLLVQLAENVTIENVSLRHGYRWAAFIGQVKGFTFTRNVIDTGKLSTEFKGHWDGPRGQGVQHVHTSQDGLHMINVVQARVLHNTIHAEDSAIAVEANPDWQWWTFAGETAANTGTRDVQIGSNFLRTNSPDRANGLMTDRDGIYGTGLAERWVGQGGVDIFYMANWDPRGDVAAVGDAARIQDVVIFRNAIENCRYGVRAGFFMGADDFNSDVSRHRVRGLTVKEHRPPHKAGCHDEREAGIRRITRNDLPGSWNRTGGVAVAVRNTDGLTVQDNDITDVKGGIGIEVIRTTAFALVGNTIRDVSGTKLAADGRWDGGEGIRVWNAPEDRSDPNHRHGRYDAGGFEIARNTISNVASYGIFITNTRNGACPRATNGVERFRPFDGRERRGIFIRDSDDVRE